MRALFGIAGILMVVVVGYYIYSAQITPSTTGTSALQQVDIVGVRSDLLILAQCEKFYLALNGRYGNLEQLRQAGNLNPFPGDNHRGGYSYEVQADGDAHFLIVARPTHPDLPALSIDETMKIKQ